MTFPFCPKIENRKNEHCPLLVTQYNNLNTEQLAECVSHHQMSRDTYLPGLSQVLDCVLIISFFCKVITRIPNSLSFNHRQRKCRWVV